MLSPITATMELFKSFETSFSTALPTFSQQENYKWFQEAGVEGQGGCCDGWKKLGVRRKMGNKKGTGIGACRTGVAGFEPTNDGVKVRCLTAWLYPNRLGDRGESNPRMSVPQTDALTTSPRSP